MILDFGKCIASLMIQHLQEVYSMNRGPTCTCVSESQAVSNVVQVLLQKSRSMAWHADIHASKAPRPRAAEEF